MTDVDAASAEPEQSPNLGRLVVWSEVEMERILRGGTGAFNGFEDDPGKSFGFLSDLEFIGIVVDDGPPERRGPPVAKHNWVGCVDDDLLPSKAHAEILRPVTSPLVSVPELLTVRIRHAMKSEAASLRGPE